MGIDISIFTKILKIDFAMICKNYLKSLILVTLVTVLAFSCKQKVQETDTTVAKPVEPIVLIETDLGNIKVKLYNETPLHRDNFLKLVTEGFYDSIVFHRVINSFMIQGGDPDTKKGIEKDKIYGSSDAGYKLPAEFNTKLFHKKGALAAARQGDKENPEKMSSGSQFYIVQGKVFSQPELDTLAARKNRNLKIATLNKLVMDKAEKLMDKGINPDFSTLPASLKDTFDLVMSKIVPYSYAPEKADFYTSVGGTPHLDGDYTVFGEVIEGIDVVDKIAAVKTSKYDMPIESIRMRMKVLKK